MSGGRAHYAAPDADPYLGLAALTSVSGLSVRTLRDRIHDAADPLPAYRVGGKLLVRRSEFDAWMRRRRYTTATVDAIVDDVLANWRGGRREPDVSGAGRSGDGPHGRRPSVFPLRKRHE